ncbi:hypothetical protein O6H91_23G039800 [Diphasiastrum complanatum]|uniref:Uncharacterized protein n=1 Tax=Diphasiastrum complanatum TaxID=34168 RepID=A0ACC2A9V0_DIPCM|nr:hypothetical protein O6H91_23G039800 [Diphasiastrum complanatum]
MPKELMMVHIPHYFRCPISLDLMRDPVTLSTGQTYDRVSIEKWVADGNTTCPATMQQLQDFTLTPNHTLRRLIQDWCVANRSKGVERIPTPKQPVEPQRVKTLLQDASPSCSSRLIQLNALKTIRSLAKESEKNRILISQQGAVPVLISALFNSLEETREDGSPKEEPSQPGIEVWEEALKALVVLPLNDADRNAIAQPTRLALISVILARGSMELRINASSLVERLSSSEELKNKVGETTGMMEGLVRLVRESLYTRAVKVGVKALFSLCLCTSTKNSERAVMAGAAAALIEHLPEADKLDGAETLATLELLCKTLAGRTAVGGHALSVPALVRMVLKVSDQATECAAGTLLAICSSSRTVQEAAVQAGVFTQMLLLIQSDCTERAKRKAMEMLKLLRSSWSNDPCISEYGRTDVVPF